MGQGVSNDDCAISQVVPSGRLVRGLPGLDKINYKGTTTRAALPSGRLVRGLPGGTKLTIKLTITTSAAVLSGRLQVQLYFQED